MKTFKTIIKSALFLLVLLTAEIFSQDFWSPIGLDSVRVESMAASPEGVLFAGTDDYPNAESLYRSTDDGVTWTPSDTGMNFAASIYNIAIGSNGYMFADSYRSSDYGHNWEYLPSGSVLNIKDIAVSANGVVYYASMSDGLLKSENNGDTLINISEGLGNKSAYSILSAVNGYLYCGTSSDLYRSTDEGATWTAMGLQLSPRVDIVAEVRGKIIACTSSGIYVSADNGDTWAYKFGSGTYTTLAGNPNGTIYVGVQFNGIIRSTDYGDTWDWFNNGITNFFVEPVIISNGFVFAGTRGGIFRGIDAVTAVNDNRDELPNKFMLSQNYPNPFNPTTTINYSIPFVISNPSGESGGKSQRISNVSLKVYDMLGREVATLVDEQKAPGNYSALFDASNFGSGVYYCKLTSGGFSAVRKMILLK